MSDQNSSKSTGNLVSDVLTNVSGMVRNEVDLARTEISENISRAGVAVGLILGAIIVALVALNVLVGALVAAIAEAGLEPSLAALLLGVILTILAFLMIGKGVNDLKLTSLAPTRAAKNIKRDADAVKEAYNDE